METPPLGSDDQNPPSLESEVFFPQGFCHTVSCLPPVLTSLVSCPWQRKQMGDTGSKIG